MPDKDTRPSVDFSRYPQLKQPSRSKPWWERMIARFKSRGAKDEKLQMHVDGLSEATERRDWDDVRSHALALGAIAREKGDAGLMKKAGRTLRRVGVGQPAWQLIAASKIVEGRPEWDGSDLAGRTLLVEHRDGDLAIFFQYASLLKPAAALAGRCVVLVEPRLAAMFRRTFPSVDVRTEGDEAAATNAAADRFASFETLAAHFWPDDETQRESFAPLRADREKSQRLRSQYLAGDAGPLIGVAWGSLNRSKEVPSLADWGRLLARLPGRFVSIQYGDTEEAIAELERWVPGRVINDRTIDQLADMDAFAAQLEALDVVVTISNTGAHLAGAMGIHAIVVLDDQFRLSWPAMGDRTATYPQTILVRKADRAWSAVMDEVQAKLDALDLQTRGRG